MIKKFILVLAVFLLLSCSTITHDKTYKINISAIPNSQVKILDSMYILPARITVTRSKSDLPITFISDSISRDYLLKSKLTRDFTIGNLALGPALFIGYATDLTNQKKYYYGKSIFLDGSEIIRKNRISIREYFNNFKENSTQYLTREFPASKGQINLTLSIPYANNFYFQPLNGSIKKSTGFFGVSGGLEYYHADKKFVSLNASAAIDSPVFVPAPVDYEGEAEFLNALSLSIAENHKFNRYTLGYGILYAKNTYRFENNSYETDTNEREPFVKANYALGFVTNAYFKFSESFYVGLNYKPTIYDVSSSKFLYEHTITLDLAWKITLKN